MHTESLSSNYALEPVCDTDGNLSGIEKRQRPALEKECVRVGRVFEHIFFWF